MRVRERPATRREASGSPPIPEEEQIAAARRDPAAFGPLYDRYSVPIYRYCYRQTRDPDVAADLTAHIFVRALERLGQYQPRMGATFRSWLFAIARNAVRDRWRRYRPESAIEESVQGLVAPDPGPEEIVVHRSEMSRLLDALAALPDRQRDIVELRIEGLGMREIAMVIGTTENAVKTAQTRAFRQLRVLLGDERGER